MDTHESDCVIVYEETADLFDQRRASRIRFAAANLPILFGCVGFGLDIILVVQPSIHQRQDGQRLANWQCDDSICVGDLPFAALPKPLVGAPLQ